MSTRKDAAATAAKTKAEGELQKAAVDALKRAGLPKDLIERTKTLPGAPFEHREAFANLSDADRLTLRKAFKDFADFPHGEFDKLTGAGDGENGRPTQAGQLIAIADDGCTLFHCGEDAFAEIENDGHRETWAVRSRGFRRWLQLRHLEEYGGAANNEALQSARDTIEAKACFKGPAREVYRRVGAADGALYLDLCNPAWQAIEADSKGWRMADRPPVRFIRSRTARDLPAPESGGGIGDLRQFLNLDEEDFTLAGAWLLAAFRDKGPYPVLVLTGEQGSAKSTCARMLRALVDPSEAPLRSVPRNEHDLFIATRSAHVIALDNLSGVPAWLSDALCRLSTGGGYAARELYSDDEEVVISAERPLILNGIDEVVARGDLADRAIFLTLNAIPDADRRPEAKLWARFEEARPRILGALLDALVEGLRRLPDVKLDRLPRMADFATWAVACEGAIFKAGAFMQAYTGNRADAVESVIDASPVASAIRELMQDRESWEGTATELHGELTRIAGESVTKGKEWPANARSFGRRFNRYKSALRPAGIELDKPPGNHPRRITISRLPEDGRNKTSQTSQTSRIAPDRDVSDKSAARGDMSRDKSATPPGTAGDVSDKSDKSLRPLSGNGKEGPANPPVNPGPNPGERLGDAYSKAANKYRSATDGE